MPRLRGGAHAHGIDAKLLCQCPPALDVVHPAILCSGLDATSAR
jgi:hypothetical protein